MMQFESSKIFKPPQKQTTESATTNQAATRVQLPTTEENKIGTRIQNTQTIQQCNTQ